MRLLLDTHIFIWWDSEPHRVPVPILTLCEDWTNTLVLSVASVWEMQIKLQLGKLRLDLPLSDIIERQQQLNELVLLPVQLPHVLALQDLPPHHRDPFDRLLIAQANVEGLAVLTADPIFRMYPLNPLPFDGT